MYANPSTLPGIWLTLSSVPHPLLPLFLFPAHPRLSGKGIRAYACRKLGEDGACRHQCVPHVSCVVLKQSAVNVDTLRLYEHDAKGNDRPRVPFPEGVRFPELCHKVRKIPGCFIKRCLFPPIKVHILKDRLCIPFYVKYIRILYGNAVKGILYFFNIYNARLSRHSNISLKIL